MLFATQKSGNKKSSGEIGLQIKTHASTKEGLGQVSGWASDVGMPNPLQMFILTKCAAVHPKAVSKK